CPSLLAPRRTLRPAVDEGPNDPILTTPVSRSGFSFLEVAHRAQASDQFGQVPDPLLCNSSVTSGVYAHVWSQAMQAVLFALFVGCVSVVFLLSQQRKPKYS